MDWKHRAREIHIRFSESVGSEYIADELTVYGLLQWLSKKRARKVLEVGAGIGTLTSAAIDALNECHGCDGAEPPYVLISLEDDSFCLGELEKNLGNKCRYFQMFRGSADITRGVGPFDFVIIDGGTLSEEYYSDLARGAMVLVQGNRLGQRSVLERSISGRAWVRAHFTSLPKQKGYWIYQLDPSAIDRVLFGLTNLAHRLVYGLASAQIKLYQLGKRFRRSGRGVIVE